EKIGGPGIIVEIDESKFGKWKYGIGGAVEGQWVLGGVERIEERQIFLVPVEQRNAATLLDIIAQKVALGSIIYTDCGRAYNSIPQLVNEQGDSLRYQHLTVNHEYNFVDPVTFCYTNTIEGTWNGIKLRTFPKNYAKKQIGHSLNFFIWRRKFKGQQWSRAMHCLRTIYFETVEVEEVEQNSNQEIQDQDNNQDIQSNYSLDTELESSSSSITSSESEFVPSDIE
ncbi:hypothetical protein INT45_009760, partial [Circinella minor]